MKYKSFGPQFRDYTPSGKPTLAWAIKRYFNQISRDENLKDSTIDMEYSNYVNHVLRCINYNIELDNYSDKEANELLERIENTSNGTINKNTIIHSFIHLVYRPLRYYDKEFHDDDKYWGSAYSFPEKFQINNLTKQKRSFTKKEEEKIANYLLFNPNTDIGENIGLTTSFCIGTRDNECTALDFKDIVEFDRYSGTYKVILFSSTDLHKNIVKSGGKSWDMPRYVAAILAYIDFIMKRMDFLNSILSFPFTDKNGTFNSVLDLPVSCRGTNYTKRCKSDDLSKAGRVLFRDVLKMREEEVAQMDIERLSAADIDVEEKSVTTYAFRRNFATRCYNLGFSSTELQYIMGHKITDIKFRRADFTDEDYLYSMYNKLKNHPINDYYFNKIDNSAITK